MTSLVVDYNSTYADDVRESSDSHAIFDMVCTGMCLSKECSQLAEGVFPCIITYPRLVATWNRTQVNDACKSSEGHVTLTMQYIDQKSLNHIICYSSKN